MGNCILNKTGGASKIVNGITEEYFAETEDIKANTFVEFINDTDNTELTTESNINIGSNSTDRLVVAINDNLLFCMYTYDYDHIWIQPIAVSNNGEITYPNSVMVASKVYYSPELFSAIKIGTNKVMLLLCKGNSSQDVSAIICSVDENNVVTVGEPLLLSSANPNGYNYIPILLPNEEVLIVSPQYKSYYILNISGLSASVLDSNTYTDNSTYPSINRSTAVIKDDKVIMTGDTGTAYVVKHFTLNENVLYLDSTVLLSSTSASTNSTLLKNKGLLYFVSGIEYKLGTSPYYSVIIQTLSVINNTVSIVNQTTLLSNIPGSIITTQIKALSSDNVIHIMYIDTQNSSTAKLGTITINGSMLKLNALVNPFTGHTYIDELVALVKYSANKLALIINNSSSNKIKILTTQPTRVKESQANISGITKSKCTTTTKGKVWTLNE